MSVTYLHTDRATARGPIGPKKTRGCLKEIQGLRQNHTTKQTEITGKMIKTKGCLTDIKTYQKANYITSRPERKGKVDYSYFSF